MPNSTVSSNRSGPCRLEWRPSRLLAAALIVLGLAAALSLWFSECPRAVAGPLAVLALAWALYSARRELRRPPQRLVIAGERASLDELPITELRLQWRGWLARLDFTGPDGQGRRLLWWPDRLDARGRRELRLAVAVSAPARDPRSMAP
ncbi:MULTISPECIES: hypothetical protein [unclassified Lysobacter]|uniref:hypothetical protein n=1 Tax=unclassified Lysobacter TaxID=2635362 RepID=UPI0004CFEF3E|nr:hypothetical protein [Lysobacter sp. ESA13C]